MATQVDLQAAKEAFLAGHEYATEVREGFCYRYTNYVREDGEMFRVDVDVSLGDFGGEEMTMFWDTITSTPGYILRTFPTFVSTVSRGSA